MTLLDAVNRILISTGELPVEALEENPITEVALAISHINMACREVQLAGWYFNSEYIELTPDDKGIIRLPFDTVSVKNLPYGLVLKNDSIYDTTKNSYIIGKKVKATLISLLPLEKLPETFALWVTLRAAKKYQDNAITSAELKSNLEREELEAMLAAKKEDRSITRYNVKSKPSLIKKILRR